MEILAARNEGDRRRTYYTLDDLLLKGYVYQMSCPINGGEYKYEGWLCSIPAWERTFKRSILADV